MSSLCLRKKSAMKKFARCDAYLTALRLDPLGISSLERLAEVADSGASPMLASWSRGRLADLHAQQSAGDNRPQLAAYQQYAGHLGGT
jgi:hypothetical protein